MSEIRTLKDGDIQVLPRTVSDAVSMKNGNSAEVEINNKADRELSNLSDYQKALHNIGAMPGKNFVDNARFAKGFIVNQIGESSYTVGFTESCIDRWKVWGTLKLEDDGIIVQKEQAAVEFMQQKMPDEYLSFLRGKLITMSVVYQESDTRKIRSESFIVAAQGPIDSPEIIIGDIRFDMYKGTAEPYARWRFFSTGSGETTIKLEAIEVVLGNHQTVVYTDDNGVLQFIDTPDYGEELARCQRYYRLLKNIQAVLGQLQNTSYYTNSMVIPDMRTTPAITLYPVSEKNNKIGIVQGVMEFDKGIGVTLVSPYSVAFAIPKDNAVEAVAGKVLTIYKMVLNAEL